MKTEHVPLIVAVIAATASVGAVLFNQRGSLALERRKWEQVQVDAHREIVVKLGKELSRAQQNAELIVWRGQHAPGQVTWSDFEGYDKVARTAMEEIFGYRVQLVAKEPNVIPTLEPIIQGFYRGDECIAKAAVTFRGGKRADAADELADCHEAVRAVSAQIDGVFADAMRAIREPGVSDTGSD